MQPEADLFGQQRQQLHAALLEYARSPGKYQVVLRQPPLLFAMLREVLQIASGRDAGGVNVEGEHALQLQSAARFFARTALLYPGADHYALLGLDRSADPAEVKDRYRLLMRLLHPDFATADSSAWPADAATRINRAYDILSSPTQRQEYDELFSPGAGAQGAPLEGRRHKATRPRRGVMSRSRFKLIVAACAVLGVAAVAASFFTGGGEPAQLVQRMPTSVPGAVNVAEQARHVALPVPLASPSGGPSIADSKDQAAAEHPHSAPLTLSMTAELTAPPDSRLGVKSAVTMPAKPNQVVPTARPAPSPGPQAAQRTQPSMFLPSAQANPPQLQSNGPGEFAQAEARVESHAAAAPVTAEPVVPPPRPAPRPGLTLSEAQPLLSQLLQQMESGRGDRLLGMLDAEARSKPAAQAFSRHYDSLVDGARPVRLSHVEFRAEPGDGRLYVVGQLRLLAGDQTIGSAGKKMSLRAEFMSRQGTVIMTGLSGGPTN